MSRIVAQKRRCNGRAPGIAVWCSTASLPLTPCPEACGCWKSDNRCRPENRPPPETLEVRRWPLKQRRHQKRPRRPVPQSLEHLRWSEAMESHPEIPADLQPDMKIRSAGITPHKPFRAGQQQRLLNIQSSMSVKWDDSGVDFMLGSFGFVRDDNIMLLFRREHR